MKKLLIGIVSAMALLVFGCSGEVEGGEITEPISNITAVVENVGTFTGLNSKYPIWGVTYKAENIDCNISWGTCYSDATYSKKNTESKSNITIYVKESDVYLVYYKDFPVYLYDKDEKLQNTYVVHNYNNLYGKDALVLFSEFTDVADNTHYIKSLYTDSNLTKEAEYPIEADFHGVKLYAEQFECTNKNYFSYVSSSYESSSDESRGIYLNDKIEAGTTELIIPIFYKTKTLGYGGYYYITLGSLKTIKIPNWYTSIARCCFQKNSSLESIDIPASVTRIERHAFNDCPSLKTINYAGTTASFQNDIKFSYSASSDSLYYLDVPLSITEQKNHDNYKNYKNLSLPTGITVHCTDGDLTF